MVIRVLNVFWSILYVWWPQCAPLICQLEGRTAAGGASTLPLSLTYSTRTSSTSRHTAFSLILLVAFLVGLYRGMRAQVLIFSWKCRTKTSMMTRRRTWSPSNTTYCTNSWLKHTHTCICIYLLWDLFCYLALTMYRVCLGKKWKRNCST